MCYKLLSLEIFRFIIKLRIIWFSIYYIWIYLNIWLLQIFCYFQLSKLLAVFKIIYFHHVILYNFLTSPFVALFTIIFISSHLRYARVSQGKRYTPTSVCGWRVIRSSTFLSASCRTVWRWRTSLPKDCARISCGLFTR